MTAVAMKAGFYDTHSKGQASVIQRAHRLIDQAIQSGPLPSAGAPFTVVDYGCSEGKNSLAAVGHVIEQVRLRAPGQCVISIHNDIHQNNFNGLCAHFLDPSYLAHKSAGPLYSFAAPGSFHEQVVPNESVHFAISTSAAHWMSGDCTGAVRDHIHYYFGTASERSYHATMAARDWLAFLRARAAELVPGGRMVLTMQGDPSEETGALPSVSPVRKVVDVMNTAILQLVDEKVISKQAYERLAIPIYPRTRSEIAAPFENELQGTLTLEHAEIELIRFPGRERFESDGNLDAYMAEVIPQIRAWSEPLLKNELQLHGEDAAIVDQIYARIESVIRDDPHGMLDGAATVWFLLFSKR